MPTKLALLLLVACCCLTAHARDEAKAAKNEGSNAVPRGQDTPPGPALSPDEAIHKMTLPEGFKVETVASEPQVINPTAFTFDDQGRIWVTESVEYPRASAGKGQDHVKILESTKHDGHYDKATIFKDGLNIPAGIAIGNGGVYITNSPDILFIKDGKEETILTGFGRDDRHELPNSLTWGPDGWLYGMNGVFNRSHVVSPGDGKVYDFTCAIWRYHPKTKIFELYAEGTSNPWGLDYNRQGDWFVSCCVIDHLFHMTQSGYYHRQGGPYPPLTHALPSITTQKHQQAAYGGLCIYDADVYPAEYRGSLFMGNLHGSCINRDTLTASGSTYVQHNAPDFLSAYDAWFMPVSEKVGPDGCIYVMDWYDKYHCYQDANRDPPGLDRTRGRIYRITYNGTPIFQPFDLQKASADELTKLLDNPNVWWRRTAQRILIEKFEPGMKSALEKLALDSGDSNNGHMHALWVLASAGAIDEPFLQKLLASADEASRDWGVRAVGLAGKASPEVLDRLGAMARDSSAHVRAQIVVAAGRLEAASGTPLLLEAMKNTANAADPLIPNLIYNNLRPFVVKNPGPILAFFNEHPDVTDAWSKTTAAWIRQAINASGRNPSEIVAELRKTLAANPSGERAAQGLQEVVDALSQTSLKRDQRAALFDGPTRQAVTKIAIGPGAARVPASIVALWWNDPVAAEAARKMVSDMWLDSGIRAQLVKALAEGGDSAKNVPAFAAMIQDANVPILIRQSAVDALGSMNNPKAADILIAGYKQMPADLKPMAVNALTHSVAGGLALMGAIEAKAIDANVVTANHARQLMGLNDKDLSAKVRSTWGEVKTERNPERVKVVEQMKKLVTSKPRGDAAAGLAVFNKTCAQCHTIYGKGGNVGPDLTGVGRENLDAVLTNILDPSLVIGAPYLVYDVRTKDGEMVSGILVEKSDKQIVLKDQTKTTTIPASEVKKINVESISMMPEGIEKTMTEQEFVDLVAFMLTREPPK